MEEFGKIDQKLEEAAGDSARGSQVRESPEPTRVVWGIGQDQDGNDVPVRIVMQVSPEDDGLFVVRSLEGEQS